MINKNRDPASIAFFILLFLFFCTGIAGAIDNPLFSDFTGAGLDTKPNSDPTVVRSRLVSVNFEQLLDPSDTSPAQSLALNLFEDVFFIAVLDRMERNSSGSYSWIGHLEGNSFNSATLVVNDKIMVGNISSSRFLYAIRVSDDGAQVIREIDRSKFPAD